MEAKPKVLLVDDEAAITANLAPFLERAGFTVAVAADGEAALSQVASFAPNLIILDVLMPKLDGREVLRRLRQAGDWTPVILLTQVGEAPERAMALEEGADDYLNKPFDPHELVARIRAVMRRAQPGQPPLATAQRHGITTAILKQRSPSCGVSRIYDGTHSGRLRVGQGVTAALLRRHGMTVWSEEDRGWLLNLIQGD